MMPERLELGSVAREGRFARLEAIEWWDQVRVENARVLVVGAGALGNEVIKNLALLGIGRVVVVDKDRVEESNLSRSVLFRPTDDGAAKAECAARGAKELYPRTRIMPIVGDVVSDVGLGFFRWADVVVGALDNREARIFVNAASARVGRPWFDGGIDVLSGVVRGFAPPGTSCYECTMNETDWKLVEQRRSCSLLARRAMAHRGTPTTPTTASIIGALQVQEVLKHLHGLPTLAGRGFIVDGLGHTSYAVSYPIEPSCPWHEPPPRVETLPLSSRDARLTVLFEEAARLLGSVDALDLSREIVERFECPSCGRRDEVFRPLDAVDVEQAVCACGAERAPVFVHSVAPGSDLARMTVQKLGLPSWDILWARRGDDVIGLELGGDDAWRLEGGAAGANDGE
jgi:adenylyltransferase/sulfurtransferase